MWLSSASSNLQSLLLSRLSVAYHLVTSVLFSGDFGDSNMERINRWVPAWAYLPIDTVLALPSSALCVSQRLTPAGCISQVHLSAGLGLVTGNRKEILPGDGGVERSQNSPHSSFQKQLYLFCDCNCRFHWTGYCYSSLGSSKSFLCSGVNSGFLMLLISGLFQKYLFLTFVLQSEKIPSFATV